MVPEIFQIELVSVPQMHDLAHLTHKCRLAVGREPHDLVLVAVMGKAEVLGERLVEDAERVRKEDTPLNPDVGALPHAPGGAAEISKTVDGDDDGLLEWRDVEGGGEMGEMVLDMVQRGAQALARKILGEERRHSLALAPVAQAIA